MFYQAVVRPALFALSSDPEDAHEFTFRSLEVFQRVPGLPRMVERRQRVVSPKLQQTILGMDFDNPVGLAAGMDKNGRCLRAWEALGFGFVEVGTITQRAQEGNPRPRMMRIPARGALRNWLGFNNGGADAASRLIEERCQGLTIPLGINVGKSRITPLDKAADDYVYSILRLHAYASYIVINVSSPNTPGLRDLAGMSALRALLGRVKEAMYEAAITSGRAKVKPVFLKLSPDMTHEQLEYVCLVWEESELEGGLIFTNTTTDPEILKGEVPAEGGTSGRPLHQKALAMVRAARRRLPKAIIVGVGGIDSGQTAYDMFAAGANLVQVLTGLVYQGPDLPRRINEELLHIMERRGIAHVSHIYNKN